MGRPSKISIACPHYTKQGISCSIRLRSHGFYLGKEQPLIKRFRCSAPNCNFNKIFQFIPEKNNWLPYCKKERHKKLDLDDVIKNGSLEKILKAIKTYHVTQVEQSKSGVSSDDTHDDTNSRTKHCFALIEKEFEYPKGNIKKILIEFISRCSKDKKFFKKHGMRTKLWFNIFVSNTRFIDKLDTDHKEKLLKLLNKIPLSHWEQRHSNLKDLAIEHKNGWLYKKIHLFYKIDGTPKYKRIINNVKETNGKASKK